MVSLCSVCLGDSLSCCRMFLKALSSSSSSSSSQRGRTERVDRHRLQNLSCPLRGASGRGNGRGRAVLSRSSGRHQGQTRGRTRRGSRAARSPVRARVGGFLRSLAATKVLATEHVATVKTYWEGNVVKSSPVQLAAQG